jgi:SAM-dependent methyltransferase
MLPPLHAQAAGAAFVSLFEGTLSSTSYQLSREESERLCLPRSSETLYLTYGDTTFGALLEGLIAAAPKAGGVFFDLGSGSGRAVLAAALLFGLSRCVGVELLESLVEQAAEPTRRFEQLRARLALQHANTNYAAATSETPRLDPSRLARSIEMRVGNLFDLVDLHTADVVYCCCASWEPPLLTRLAEKLAAELADGTRILTVGKPLLACVELPSTSGQQPSRRVHFVETWHGLADLEWGQELLVVHIKRSEASEAN